MPSQTESYNHLTTIGIVGEGKMGSGILYYLTAYPYVLRWLCSNDADLGQLSRQFSKKVGRMHDHGLIDDQRYEQLKQTVITCDPGDLADAGLVIEAVNENADLKREIFRELDLHLGPGAILATNTSSIRPSLLIPSEKRAPYIAGLHFFYPVALKNIAEITVTSHTSARVLSTLEQFLTTIGRRYLVMEENNSFVLNRIFLEVQNEAAKLVQQGCCDMAAVDTLVKEQLFEFGIFDFCDSVGIDTMLAAVTSYTSGSPDWDDYRVFSGMLRDLIDQGKTGRKSGEGFYRYPREQEQVELPANQEEIVHHLYNTWLMAVRRFAMQAHLPIGDINHAVKEYFGVQTGPFDRK